MHGREEVYSEKIRAGKRTYFFDVRSTRSSDYYITITESKRKFNGRGYDKHKIFLYKEDFNKFIAALNNTVEYVKTDLMPDYDYDEFDRKNREYEAEQALSGGEDDSDSTGSENVTSEEVSVDSPVEDEGADDAGSDSKEEELSTSWED